MKVGEIFTSSKCIKTKGVFAWAAWLGKKGTDFGLVSDNNFSLSIYQLYELDKVIQI